MSARTELKINFQSAIEVRSTDSKVSHNFSCESIIFSGQIGDVKEKAIREPYLSVAN